MDPDHSSTLDRRQLLGEGLAGILRMARALPSAGVAAAALGTALVGQRERKTAPPAACFPAATDAPRAAAVASLPDAASVPSQSLTPATLYGSGVEPRDPQGGVQ